MGCGATPGITNVLASYGSSTLKKINSIEIVFADIDYTKYDKAFILPYSFHTIVDEYEKKPAVYRNKKLIFVEPGSGIKTYDFKLFGKQKGFYTLHSELATFPSSFKDKGIKNIEFRVTFDEEFNEVIENLIELGFTSNSLIEFTGKKFKIINITSSMMDRLLPKPTTHIDDKEMLRVDFNKGKLKMDAVIKSTHNVPAGTYDTGIPCSIIAQMLSENLIKKKGVYPPERVINPVLFFKELKKRGIVVLKNGKKIN